MNDSHTRRNPHPYTRTMRRCRARVAVAVSCSSDRCRAFCTCDTRPRLEHRIYRNHHTHLNHTTNTSRSAGNFSPFSAYSRSGSGHVISETSLERGARWRNSEKSTIHTHTRSEFLHQPSVAPLLFTLVFNRRDDVAVRVRFRR
jgi:hypothetical protein